MDISPYISKKILFLLFYFTIASIPIIYGFYYIFLYGVNIPVWEQWELISWTISYYEDNFQIKWLFTLQNDSRAFFAFLPMLILSILTNANMKFLYYCGFIFYLLAFLLVFCEAKNDLGNKYIYLVFLLPITFYWFNPFYLTRYIFNIGGFSGSLLILFVIITVLSLDRSRRSPIYFFCSLLMAFICSFSGAWGLLIWFTGSVQLLLQNTENSIKRLLIWIMSAAGTLYLYFFALGFQEEGIHGTAGYSAYILTALTYPAQKFLCFLGVLGAQVVHNPDIAFIFGALIFCIFVSVLYVNRNDLMPDTLSKWYALITFWILTSLTLALTRSGAIGFADFGHPDAIYYIPDPRHSPTMFFTLIGIYLLVLIYLRYSLQQNENGSAQGPDKAVVIRTYSNIFLLGIVFTLLICGAMLHVNPGIDIGKGYLNQGIEGSFLLMNYNVSCDEHLLILHPEPASLRLIIPQMKAYKLSAFSDDEMDRYNSLSHFGQGTDLSKLPLLSNTTHYSIDLLNEIRNPLSKGQIIINKTESTCLKLTGWAIDSPNDSLAKAVFISVDGDLMIPARYMQERRDVADHFGAHTLKNSGFRGSFATHLLRDGNHTIFLYIASNDGAGYYESNSLHITVIS